MTPEESVQKGGNLMIEEKTKKKTNVKIGLAGLLAVSGLMSFLIYRYRKYKNENKYYDNITKDDIAWGQPVAEKTDKIFNTYKQYCTLISGDTKKDESFVNIVAAHLTIAHVIDDLKDDEPSTARKMKAVWRANSSKFLY